MKRLAFLVFPVSAERRLRQRVASRKEGLARQDIAPTYEIDISSGFHHRILYFTK
jgi:hypothetical protein